jgi:hypothetical protein
MRRCWFGRDLLQPHLDGGGNGTGFLGHCASSCLGAQPAVVSGNHKQLTPLMQDERQLHLDLSDQVGGGS